MVSSGLQPTFAGFGMKGQKIVGWNRERWVQAIRAGWGGLSACGIVSCAGSYFYACGRHHLSPLWRSTSWMNGYELHLVACYRVLLRGSGKVHPYNQTSCLDVFGNTKCLAASTGNGHPLCMATGMQLV